MGHSTTGVSCQHRSGSCSVQSSTKFVHILLERLGFYFLQTSVSFRLRDEWYAYSTPRSAELLSVLPQFPQLPSSMSFIRPSITASLDWGLGGCRMSLGVCFCRGGPKPESARDICRVGSLSGERVYSGVRSKAGSQSFLQPPPLTLMCSPILGLGS